MNKKIPDQFGFYAVLTDPLKGYEYLTSTCVQYNVAFVQLRMKSALESEVYRIAKLMKKITDGTRTKLVINDFPQIAADVGADAVHVGQNDQSYDEVRNIVGTDMIVGISTHSEQQAINTSKCSPDYIGAGPVYPTPTKKIPDPAIGTEGLKKILGCIAIPAVAIGGINLDNFREVLDAGAVNFCMVRQVTQAADPGRIIKTIQTIYNEYYPGFYR
ncbi:MAG TPA: thiamine phosphate synthase [Chitinispirillaceae bacterium]|nr:thiamine phosphate synthase [Chitinispirillaceae bacterium]